MKLLLRNRVWLPAAAALVIGLVAAWQLTREQVLQHIDPATIEHSVGRKVRMKGVMGESRIVMLHAADGTAYVLDWKIPQDIPIGNEVLVTGRLSKVPSAGNQSRLLRLQDQKIVDLGTKPPPTPPSPPPPSSPIAPIRIDVTAKQWEWWFRYPGGRVSRELHLPKDQPVRLDLISADVVHSMRLVLPQGQHVGCSAVPGGYVNQAVVTAPQVGQARLRCGEYCGARHSECGADVIVEAAPDFQLWMSRPEPATQPASP